MISTAGTAACACPGQWPLGACPCQLTLPHHRHHLLLLFPICSTQPPALTPRIQCCEPLVWLPARVLVWSLGRTSMPANACGPLTPPPPPACAKPCRVPTADGAAAAARLAMVPARRSFSCVTSSCEHIHIGHTLWLCTMVDRAAAAARLAMMPARRLFSCVYMQHFS